MNEVEKTYFLDLTIRKNRERIEGAIGKIPIKVFVRLAEDRTAAPIEAIGKLSQDETEFVVTVNTTDGQFEHVRGWDELKRDLLSHEKYD